MGKVIDHTGQRFGRLTVLERKPNKNGFAQWLCKCDCGNTTIVIGYRLRQGVTRSCGCLLRECASKRLYVHGQSRSRLHVVWSGMIQRCNDPHHLGYSRYGGRGISVCPEWQVFIPFRDWALNNGYADELTLDRIDVNGDYEPSNCRWIPLSKQARNKSTSHLLTFNGQTKCLAEWAEITGIRSGTILSRLSTGWSIEEALTTPVGRKRKKS